MKKPRYDELARSIHHGAQQRELREFILPDRQPDVRNTNTGILIEVPMIKGFTCVIDVLFCRTKSRSRTTIRGQKIVWRVYASIKDATQAIATEAVKALRIACEFVRRQIARRGRLHEYRNSRQVRYRKSCRQQSCYAH